MTKSQLSSRDDTLVGQARLPQPQWQNLFVAPTYAEGFVEQDEQEWAEEQAPSIQSRTRGGRRTHGRAA
ncbi:hypothetical protein [Streptomyces sp. NBC_01361]|uniref:hypothetical protein n=1 Tax=Streptomyces sp. NBC_01361 TaxID=2903838 RepID=UPI002E37F5E4|nr:hypothetical protein [Streptomyces sp. NBC_01361]